jgi:hypothetical protein
MRTTSGLLRVAGAETTLLFSYTKETILECVAFILLVLPPTHLSLCRDSSSCIFYNRFRPRANAFGRPNVEM